jgi:hypothetical protein
MNKISSFTKNPFFSINTSRDSIQQFAYDHIQRMKAANNPNYASLIADTEACWDLLFGNLQTYDTQRNLRLSLTIQVNRIMKQFAEKALELEPLVVFKFKKDSGTYQEFYPHHRSEFHEITQENVLVLMERMVAVCHKYATDLGATWETDFIALRDDFKTVFASQKETKGSVTGTIPEFDLKLKNLYLQLFSNLTAILHENYTQPEVLLGFFDQSIVNYVSHPKADEDKGYTLLVPANGKAVANISFSVDDNLLITNNADVDLQFFFAPTSGENASGPMYTIAGGDQKEVNAGEAGAPANKFLIFVNSSDEEAEVEIMLI